MEFSGRGTALKKGAERATEASAEAIRSDQKPEEREERDEWKSESTIRSCEKEEKKKKKKRRLDLKTKPNRKSVIEVDERSNGRCDGSANDYRIYRGQYFINTDRWKWGNGMGNTRLHVDPNPNCVGSEILGFRIRKNF